MPCFYKHFFFFHFRIHFKFLLFTFKCLNGLFPPYLSDLIAFCEYKRTLRSANTSLRFVVKSKYKRWGDRDFSVIAPRLWNQLAQDLCFITDLGLSKSNLKTFYSGRLLTPSGSLAFLFYCF